MTLSPPKQCASPRVVVSGPSAGRVTLRVMTERTVREADECLVGRFSARLPRAVPRKA